MEVPRLASNDETSREEESIDHYTMESKTSKSILEKGLRSAVKRVEEATSYDARQVLNAVEQFLMSWDALDTDEIPSLELPCDFLRRTMSQVQKRFAHGHEALRKPILSLLRNLRTKDCRSLAIEFVPLMLPIQIEEKSIGNVMIRDNTRNIKKELLALLKDILQEDTTLLRKVLMDTLPQMTQDKLLMSRDVFHFSLEFLTKTPEKDLHILMTTLFRFMETGAEAQDAIDALRTEFSLLEHTDVSDMYGVISVFDTLKYEKRGPVIIEQYVSRCEEIVEELSYLQQHKSTNSNGIQAETLTVFDWTFLLLVKEHKAYLERIAALIHASIVQYPRLFWSLCPDRFVQLVGEAQRHSIERPRYSLYKAYTDACLSMFLSYCHSNRTSGKTSIFEVNDYLMKAIRAVSPVFQEQLLQKLLNHFETFLRQCQREGIWGRDGLLSLENATSDSKGRALACRGILSIAVAVANEAPLALAPFRLQFSRFLESNDLHSPKQDPSTVASLCQVVTALSVRHIQDDSRDDLILLCQRLMFSHPDLTTIVQRQLRGLELLNTMIRESDNPSIHTVPAGRQVKRLLEMNWSNTNHSVGAKAIRMARYLHLREGVVFDGKDAIGRILSKEKTIKYPQKGDTMSQNRGTIVRYGDMPTFLQRLDKAKPQKFRTMLSSFETFLASDASLVKPSTWQQSVLWLYTLLEAFLAVGRPSKWIPQAWTEAGIEFPGVPTSFGDKGNVLKSWFREVFGLFDCRDFFDTSKADQMFGDTMANSVRASDRKEVTNFSNRFAVSLLLGLSASGAILNNVYDYFKEVLEEGSAEEKREARVLIQHQLIKIYDLQRHVKSMRKFFISEAKKQRKRGRPSTKKKSVPDKIEAAEQIDNISKFFFSSDSFVDSRAVWVGLTDPEHDTIIISSLGGTAASNLTEARLSSILSMRFCMLSDLSLRMKYGNSSEILSEVSSDLRQRIAQFLRLAVFLSLHGQNRIDNELVKKLVNKVSEGYLNIVFNVLVSLFRSDVHSPTAYADDTVYFFNLYRSLVGSHDPMNDAIQELSSGFPSTESFKDIGISCFEKIQRCSTATGNRLLETLSVFAIKFSSGAPAILSSMIDLHWESSKLNVHETQNISEAPFALTVFLERFGSTSLPIESVLRIEDRCLQETLCRLIPAADKSEEEHSWVTHVMCRHWSLLALSPKRAELFVDHINRFLSELRSFLEDNDKPQEISVPIAIHATTTGKPFHKSVTDDITDLAPTKDAIVSSSDSFPSLNGVSCPQYFDTLLKLTVASIGILSVREEIQACRKHNSRFEHHPFTTLEHYFEVSGSLIEMLQNDTTVLFPEGIPPTVMQTLKLLLDVSLEKLEQCIDWQNEKAPTEESDARAPDLTGPDSLKELIHTFCVEILGSIMTLCAETKGTNAKMAASLNRKAEKALHAIRQISLELDLGEVKTQSSDASGTNHEPRAKRRKTGASQQQQKQQQFDASTIEEPSQDQEHVLQANDDTRDELGDDVDDEEDSWSGNGEDDDSSDSGDFGVSGDWGQGKKEDDKSSDDDESSRQLGEITITR